MPFTQILDAIREKGYHDHRSNSHSNLLTERMVADLAATCPSFVADRAANRFREWRNTLGPDRRNTDLLIGAANADGSPGLRNVRILIEHKSVVTAHRNRNAHYQDIEREMLATHDKNPRTIVVATLIVGVCQRVLNVPDCVKKDSRYSPIRFQNEILPRLSTGDQTVWTDFPRCISTNTPEDPATTVAMFRGLPVRAPADSHEVGLDFMLFVPVEIDNVNPPRLGVMDGIDSIADYQRMIQHIC